MRADPSERAGPVAARLREALARLSQRWSELGLIGRLVLAAAILAALVAAAQLIPWSSAPSTVPLYSGHRFAPDEARRVVRTLEAKSIAARSTGGRIEVPAAMATEALTIVEKAGLAPRSSRDLLNTRPVSSLIPTQAELEQTQRRNRELFLEEEIHEIDPSISAIVRLFPKRGRGLGAEETLRATVKLVAEGDQRVAPQLVDAVITKMLFFEPDLAAERLRILDGMGRAYLVPGKPELIEQSSLRAREQELEGAIHGKLAWIEGVRVEVQITPAEPPSPAPIEPPTVIAVNEPLDDAVPTIEPTRTTTRGQARVVVRVPTSYYKGHHDQVAKVGEPSAGDLIAFERKTEESIRSAVAMAVPPGELGEVHVDRIFFSGEAPAIASAPKPVGESMLPWAPALAVAGGAVIAALGVLGHRLRRQPPQSVTTLGPRRVRSDPASDPAARVRELVRIDPAAGASVLQRWIGQTEEGPS